MFVKTLTEAKIYFSSYANILILIFVLIFTNYKLSSFI